MNVPRSRTCSPAPGAAALVALLALLAPACDDPGAGVDPGSAAAEVDDSPEARVARWVETGGWKAALSGVEHALTETPDDPEWQALAARAEMELGHFHAAGTRLMDALLANPTDPHLGTERGVFEASRNRHEEAVRVLEVVVEQAPELARAHEHLGRSLEFESLIRMGSRGIDYDVLDRAIAALQRSLELEETAERFNALGGMLERARRLEEARAAHVRATELAPEDPDGWHALGRILTELGQLDAAHEAFEPALRHDQENAETWFDYGVLVEEMGLAEKARYCYSRAIEYDQYLPRAFYRLGLLTSQGGDAERGDEFIAQYQRLQEIHDDLQAWRYEARTNPEDPETLFQTGLAFLRLGRWDEGLGMLERAAKLRPDDARTHFQIARVHARAERLPEALAELDRAVELDPDHLGAHRLRAQVSTPQGALAKAAESFEAIVRLRPDEADAWFNAAQARRQVESPERALEAFERCLALAPEHRLALEMAARVELGLDRLDAARRRAEALLALEPQHPVATAILAEVQQKTSSQGGSR